MTTITIDDLKGCKLQQTAHLTGQGWFGYMHRCVEHPRLQRRDKYLKKDRSVSSTWFVDGVEVGTLAQAVEKLAEPPELTLNDIAGLGAVGTEFADIRKSVSFFVLYGLTDKGLIEWQAGACRLTQAGVEAKSKLVA